MDTCLQRDDRLFAAILSCLAIRVRRKASRVRSALESRSVSLIHPVDISTLPAAQLTQIKKQLDDELQTYNGNYMSLRTALAKFKDCIKSIQTGVAIKSDKPKALLVPLTTSLYVPGTLADSEHVLVEIGTGFYVEKTTDDAIKFYEGKVTELTTSTKNLEGILEGKSNSLRVVEEVLRQKIMAGEASGQENDQGTAK